MGELPFLDMNQGACKVMVPEMVRLVSVPATTMVCEFTMYATKFSVEDGVELSLSCSVLRVLLLVVPSPPTVRPLPETTMLKNAPWLELNSEKSTAPLTLPPAALEAKLRLPS